MQTQITPKRVIEEETKYSAKDTPLENKLEYTNNKRPSKPSLPHVLDPSKLLLPTDLTKPCLF